MEKGPHIHSIQKRVHNTLVQYGKWSTIYNMEKGPQYISSIWKKGPQYNYKFNMEKGPQYIPSI